MAINWTDYDATIDRAIAIAQSALKTMHAAAGGRARTTRDNPVRHYGNGSDDARRVVMNLRRDIMRDKSALLGRSAASGRMLGDGCDVVSVAADAYMGSLCDDTMQSEYDARRAAIEQALMAIGVSAADAEGYTDGYIRYDRMRQARRAAYRACHRYIYRWRGVRGGNRVIVESDYVHNDGTRATVSDLIMMRQVKTLSCDNDATSLQDVYDDFCVAIDATTRDRQIIARLLRGQSQVAIANALRVSPQAINKRLASIRKRAAKRGYTIINGTPKVPRFDS